LYSTDPIAIRFFYGDDPGLTISDGTLIHVLDEYIIHTAPDKKAPIIDCQQKLSVPAMEQINTNVDAASFIDSCNTCFTPEYNSIKTVDLMVFSDGLKELPELISGIKKVSFLGTDVLKIKSDLHGVEVFINNLKS
jgi:hypothetical protein